MNFWINLCIYLGIGVIVGLYWNIWIRRNSTNPEVDLKPLSLWGQTLLAGYLWPITVVRLIWR